MATRGRIRYGTKIGNRFNISNDIEELKEVDSKTNILTGFDIDTTSFTGDEGYFVKQSGSGEKAVLIRVQNLNTANPKVRGFKPLNYSTYGMAYYADYVYITSKGSTVVKSSAKSRNDTARLSDLPKTGLCLLRFPFSLSHRSTHVPRFSDNCNCSPHENLLHRWYRSLKF